MALETVINLTLRCGAAFGVMLAPGLAQAQSIAGTVPACQIADAVKPKNCDKNMFATTVRVMVLHGDYAKSDDPPCRRAEEQSELKRQIDEGLKAYPTAAKFAGPLIKFAGTKIEEAIRGVGGDLGRFVTPYVNGNHATCAPLVVVVPAGAKVEGQRLYGGDKSGGAPIGQCWVEKPPCVGGWARFETPTTLKSKNVQMVYTIFKNWSHDRDREAAMTVFFTMPKDEEPDLSVPTI